jgi:predicted cobalt transporter CbtA
VHTGVFGSNTVLLCQTFVSNPAGAAVVGGGDSGSGVFSIRGRDHVRLLGILWGGSGSTTFVFSPLKSIQDELGAVTATR